MRIDQRKRWTRHVFLIDAEGARNSLNQYRFACAQWTIEQNDFSAAELISNLDAQIERLAFRLRDPFTGGNFCNRRDGHFTSLRFDEGKRTKEAIDIFSVGLSVQYRYRQRKNAIANHVHPALHRGLRILSGKLQSGMPIQINLFAADQLSLNTLNEIISISGKFTGNIQMDAGRVVLVFDDINSAGRNCRKRVRTVCLIDFVLLFGDRRDHDREAASQRLNLYPVVLQSGSGKGHKQDN